MSRFEEINIGDTAEIVHKITEMDIERFVELTGDDNKIHVDKCYNRHYHQSISTSNKIFS